MPIWLKAAGAAAALGKLLGKLRKKPDKPNKQKACIRCRDNISEGRAKHILDGDKTGGGHRYGTGKPGKSEFPSTWNDDKILDNISDVAKNGTRVGPGRTTNSTMMEGVRDGVRIRTIVSNDGQVITGWPQSGPGVRMNPR
jgi:hypothetical protein